MLKIYGSDLSSYSNKVRYAANAMELEYEYHKINLRAGQHREEWFLAINPFGKVPAIDDGGFVLFESDAIIKYLATKKRSALYPEGLHERARVNQWMSFVSMHIGGAMSKVAFNRVFFKYARIPVDERAIQDGLEFLSRFLPVIDKRLSKNTFLTGDQLSLADISLIAMIDPAEIADVDLSSYAHLVKYRKDFAAQPFYQKCHAVYGEMFLKKKE